MEEMMRNLKLTDEPQIQPMEIATNKNQANEDKLMKQELIKLCQDIGVPISDDIVEDGLSSRVKEFFSSIMRECAKRTQVTEEVEESRKQKFAQA